MKDRDFKPPDPGSWVPFPGNQPPAEPWGAPPGPGASEPASAQDPVDAPSVALPLPDDLGPALPISLGEVILLAGSQAIDLQVAREAAQSGQSEERIAQDSLLPTLSLRSRFNAADGRVQDPDGEFFDAETQSAFYGAGAALTYDPAKAFYTVRAATERADALNEGIRVASQDVIREAAVLYFDLVESYAVLGIAESSLDHSQELVRLEEVRLSGGVGLESDLLRAQARESETRRSVIAARNRVTVGSSELAALLGLSIGSTLVPQERELRATAMVPAAPVEELVAQGLARRPETRQLEHFLRSTREEERYWEARWRIPSVELSGEYGEIGPNLGETEDQLRGGVSISWDFAPTAPAEVERARAQRRQVALEQERVQRRIEQEVVKAHADVRASFEQIHASQIQADAAQRAYDQIMVRYETGVVIQLTVLAAEVDLARAQTALVTSLASFNRAQFDLLRAVGGPQVLDEPGAGDDEPEP